MWNYKIKDEEGWEIREQEFEAALENVCPDYIIGDSRDLSNSKVKVYGIMEEDRRIICRLDVVYRQCETEVSITGEASERLTKKLIKKTSFKWEGGLVYEFE